MIVVSVSENRSPEGSTIEPGPRAADALDHAPDDLEGPGVEPVVGRQLDLDGAHEAVALVPGVLAGGVGQLAAEAVLDALELLEVVVGQRDGEVVGHHGAAADADGAVVVHLAHQPAAQLDRPEPALERPGERALDHALEASFEAADPHRQEVSEPRSPPTGGDRAGSGRRASR